MVQSTRSEVTDCTRSSYVVRGFESVSGYYNSSFHRVRCMTVSSYLTYLFLVLRIGRSREYIDIVDEPILIKFYPLRILA